MNQNNIEVPVSNEMALNYHLMHPGGDSAPGDPNPAFYLDGTYHLHYILRQTWRGNRSFCFVHVTSPDMLNWSWQTTKLQPSFTGHGMYSGTGFITKEGQAAAIYHGQASQRNHIAIAKDRNLSAWEKPFPVEPKTTDGTDAEMRHWDPDCFLIGDTYYAISGGRHQPLSRSQDLRHWTYVGDFLRHELPDAAIGEDISCPNFFRLGDKWMLLCISHPFGCRYYLGDWDAEAEQFVPQLHGRMNWRRAEQSLTEPGYRDFFAPESVLTPDGRRVMWAWLCTADPAIDLKSVQSLPRELSLHADGTLRIEPLRELKTLRYDPVTLHDVVVPPLGGRPAAGQPSYARTSIAEPEGDAFEVRVTVDRAEAERHRFGVLLFADDDHEGLPVLIRPETGTICAGATEAPFAVADLPAGEDLELRIFVDKYLVEVFVNGRQALLTVFTAYRDGGSELRAYLFGSRGRTPPLTLRTVEIWKLRPTNQGFFEARANRIWEPDTQ
jgi:sucrose-6-phosphate hydrolase SacC (GH32 family)